MKWKDKKDRLLSSIIDNPKKKVLKVNHTTGDVDKFDQQMQYYPVARRDAKSVAKTFSFNCTTFRFIIRLFYTKSKVSF